MEERRVGKFRISFNNIDNEPETVRYIMGKMIVIRAEALYHIGCIEYTAYCTEFDEVPKGNVIPNYDVIIDGATNITFNRETF